MSMAMATPEDIIGQIREAIDLIEDLPVNTPAEDNLIGAYDCLQDALHTMLKVREDGWRKNKKEK